jgi:hypothetical protein
VVLLRSHGFLPSESNFLPKISVPKNADYLSVILLKAAGNEPAVYFERAENQPRTRGTKT